MIKLFKYILFITVISPLLLLAQAPQTPLPSCLLTQLHGILSQADPKTKLLLAGLIKDPNLRGQFEAIKPDLLSGKVSLEDPKVQKLLVDVMVDLNDSGHLTDFMSFLADTAIKLGKVPPALANDPQKLQAYIGMSSEMIDSSLRLHGLTNAPDKLPYTQWRELSTKCLVETRDAMKPFEARIASGQLRFDDVDFAKMLEQKLGTRFAPSKITRLSEGAPALAERKKAVDEADEIIHMTWAFYDDDTGRKVAKDLIDAKKRGANVKVLVDGQLASHPGHDQVLKDLADNGIEVMKWKSEDPRFPYYGNHRKVLVTMKKDANGQPQYKAILGGRNPGDVYYTTWTDSEVLIEGDAAEDLQRMIASNWNEQRKHVASNNLTAMDARPQIEIKNSSAVKTAVVDHKPWEDANIIKAHLLGLKSLGKGDEAYIENAYLIIDSSIYKEIRRAQKRGVKIKIMTNSMESVDEPTVSKPIMNTVNRLVNTKLKSLQGTDNLELYVKQGKLATDHTKVAAFRKQNGSGMIIDTSYNLHPRSQRIEGEVAAITIGNKPTDQAIEMMSQRMKDAQRVTAPVPLKKGYLDMATQFGFWDQL